MKCYSFSLPYPSVRSSPLDSTLRIRKISLYTKGNNGQDWQHFYRTNCKGLEVKFRLLSFCFAFILLAQFAGADVIQLGASKDTTIFSGNQSQPNNANQSNGAGGAPGLFAGTDSNITVRRGLIAFDVSTIPSNATITDVQLRLVVGQAAGGGSFPNPIISLHKLLVPWGEANTGASNASNLSGIGQGSAALDGDATWLSRVYNQSPPQLWNTPGGLAGADYVDTASVFLVQGNTTGSISTWLSTPSLVADVQGWLTTPSSNNGWMLINANETAAQTFRGFYSRNYNPSSGVTPSELANLMPQLTVTYTPVPEPSTVAFVMFGVATISVVVRNRRRCVK
jgi:hypothetical protein